MSDDHNNDDDELKNIIEKWKKNIDEWEKLAEQGDDDAQLNLSLFSWYRS